MEYWETYRQKFEKPKVRRMKKDNYTLYYDKVAMFGELPYGLCVFKINQLMQRGGYVRNKFEII